jgi:hypothetical protein
MRPLAKLFFAKMALSLLYIYKTFIKVLLAPASS